MFKIYGGATKFKQWTKDNKLIMDELPIGADVMFYNDPNEDDPLITEGYEIRDEEDNVFRVCDVPNILLAKTEKIKVRIPKVVKGLYGNLYKAAGRNEMIFEVEPAEKPSDYVYEKTEMNTIDPSRLPTSIPMIDSAVVGQVPKVAAVDENGAPTKWEAGEAGSQQIQSDWNQNDENAPDYVKNRPCYKYTEFIDAVSETTLDAATASEGYYTATIQGDHYTFGNTESASVVYDGTTYENVPASHDESWVGGAPQSVDTVGSIPEYPFKIVMKNGSYENNLTLYAETQGEHTFCIKKPVNKVKTLDNEYIPKNVASLPGAYHGYTDGYPILYVSGFEEYDNGFKRASDFSALSMSSIEGWTFTLEDGTTVIKRVGIFR